MEENFYGNRLSNVSTLAELESNGKWKLTIEVTQKRRKKLEDEWESKSMDCTTYNLDLNKAVAEASVTIATYLDSYEGDLFNEDIKEKSKIVVQ
jgi:hypothetical protein